MININYYYWKLWTLLLAAVCMFTAVNATFFPSIYPRLKLDPRSPENAGDPLFITPYLKKGNITLAQNLSHVPITEKIGFRSYAGFFTIDEKYDSNLYFWYFPPLGDCKDKNAPVMLWLQGGPGGSSLFGLFTEIGPLIAKKEGFALRKYHWALQFHLIFVDNPVGTGFSFTKNLKGYCTDELCVAKGLHSTLTQFFQLFPDLKEHDFFIAGESYAGKYIPSLGMEIHKQNSIDSKNKINLKGMALGNAYCDPINQLDYGSYLYQIGLIDSVQLKVFQKYQKEIQTQIKKENWKQADVLMDKLLDGELTNFSYFRHFTGFNYYYNFLQSSPTDDMTVFINLLQNDNIRHSVHVGGLEFHDGSEVQLLLALDMLKSVAPEISELLSHYRMMFYNGQLDIVVAYPLTLNFLKKLKFAKSDEYCKAPRHIWKVDDNVAGYVKQAGNLTEVLVRNAGHMVPKDQPLWALDLITRFVKNDFKFEE